MKQLQAQRVTTSRHPTVMQLACFFCSLLAPHILSTTGIASEHPKPATANSAQSDGATTEANEESTWSRFRGNNGRGVVPVCNVPLPWTNSDVAWEQELQGTGNASPIVWDGTVFLQSADPKTAEQHVQAFELATGKVLWTKSYASNPYHLHSRSSFASSTPCVNGSALFVSWDSGESVVLKALTHQGDEIWSRDLGRYVSQHGYGASPTLVDDTLVLFNSQASEQLPPNVKPGSSRVMAFDPTTGESKWETSIPTTRACYGVPSRYETKEGTPAILFADTGAGMFALDLATGAKLWSKKVFSKRTVSCPLVVGDMAIGTEGSGGGGNRLFAVSLHGNHDLQFEIDRAAPYVPTPIATSSHLFLWSDKGIVTCYRLADQEIIWTKRVGGNVSTSPVLAGDKLIGIAEDGTLTILSASESFRELGAISLDDTTRATPVVAENYLLIRTNSKLLCVGTPTLTH